MGTSKEERFVNQVRPEGTESRPDGSFTRAPGPMGVDRSHIRVAAAIHAGALGSTGSSP